MEEIIDISPAYNADKSGKGKKSRKKKETANNKIEQPEVRYEGKEEPHQRISEIIQQESEFEMDPPMFKTKKSSFISNVDPLDVRHYITRSMSNHEWSNKTLHLWIFYTKF